MLREEIGRVNEVDWAMASEVADWREVDRRLRGLARRRARLDHEEMELLREAMRVQVWRQVGYASMREYLERVFGYGPRVASDRLRVAAALDAMPELDDALASEELPYSAVREISRIATTRTAGAWVEACRGKCLREIEELVAERAEGDLPDSTPRPELRKQFLRLELEGSDYALWRQARQVLESERDEAVSDRALFAAACSALIEQAARCGAAEPPLGNGGGPQNVGGPENDGEPENDGGPETDGGSERDGEACSERRAHVGARRLGSESQRGRAKYQIAVVVCEACKRGWQEGGGKRIPISAADVARAECDAQRIGSLDDGPQSAAQDVPPKTRRFVFRRDGDRCTVPGCRASAFIEVHHIVPREVGGGHEPENLTLLCGGHHDAHHAGALVIRGRAPELTFEFVGAHVGKPPGSVAAVDGEPQPRADAILAITTLGYMRHEAIAAVDAALAASAIPMDLERLLRAALQRCPKP